MERRSLNNILEECINQLQPDGSNLKIVLAQHPEYTAELQPLLRTILELRAHADELRPLWQEILKVPHVKPSLAAKTAARDSLLFAVKRQCAEKTHQETLLQEVELPVVLAGT